MFNPLPTFAIGIGAEAATAMIIKGLAVGGGFLVGYFLGRVVAWALDRWLFAQKAPDQLKKAVALLAGVALAVLVALFVFGEGGNGLFGSGGQNGENKGTPTDDNKQAQPEPQKEVPKEKEEPKPKEVPKPTPGDVRVAILSGTDVQNSRFYLMDNDPMPKTFPELKQAIETRRKSAASELTIIFRFKTEPLTGNHLAVKQVVEWVKEEKLLNRFE